ncbi:MAG: DUF4286 family protein [Chitinophagia bacterium]|nr:DUF4286 family protein [Chitinophagia bacterium]
MYIYNVTSRVEAGLSDEWLAWMRVEHIPRVLATGLFTHHRILRLLDTEDADGQTFAVQYFTTTREGYEKYLAEHAPALRGEVTERWGEAVLSFRTFMEVIN